MAVANEKFLTGQLDVETTGEDRAAFEQEMLERVNQDFEAAKKFRRRERERVITHVQQYANAHYYDALRAKSEFPVPIGQMLTDQFRAQLCDKLFFAGRPCRIVGAEETDKKDADAKQAMMDWQDVQDDIREKISQGVFDCGLRGRAVAQVDYAEITEPGWSIHDVPVEDLENYSEYDQEIGEPPPIRIEKQWVKVPVTKYIGAVTKIVDPQDLYFGPDKREVSDSFPLMIKTSHPREYFRSRPYFYNFKEIDEKSGPRTQSAEDQLSIDAVENPEASQTSENLHDYVEWQGLVEQVKLLAFMKSEDQGEPGKLVWAICGVVDGKTVVRLEDESFDLDGPNIVIGCAERHGSVFRSVSLMDKMYAICRAADRALGTLITNIEQNVDAMWIVNEDALSNKKIIVNKRGKVLTSNRPPSEVAQRIEQLPLTEPLQSLLAYYTQLARDATGLQAITTGQGDPNAETLGESAMVEAHAVLGLNDYLATFEETFVQPLYAMRNKINMALITEDFSFRVIGEKAVDWRPIQAGQVKASVDFICESSTRETNRAVVTQQLLRFLEIAPKIISMGFPVRMDELAKMIGESGYTMSQEQLERLLPLLKLEQEMGIDIGRLMAESALLQMGINQEMLKQAAVGGVGPDGQVAPTNQPLTEGDAQQSANAENQVNVGNF